MKTLSRVPVVVGTRSRNGSVLLEVMIALSLMGIVLVSLGAAASSLLSRAARVDWSPSEREDESTVDAWTWGPRPGGFEWLPGPRLELRLQGAGTQGAESIGVWVDGWFTTEVRALGQRALSIGDAGMWSTRPGAEVVFRARRSDGPWGVPLRTVVPSVVAVVGSMSVQGDGSASVTVHLRAAGHAALGVEAEGTPGTVAAVGTPATVVMSAVGLAQVTSTGGTQQIQLEEGTGVDVYQ